MQCIICDSQMRQRTKWAWHCTKCHFWRTNLQAGVGRGVEGLETLRRENFKILCKWLERIAPLERKSCLEIGCAEGWFLDEIKKYVARCQGIEPSKVAQTALDAGHDVKVGLFPNVLNDGASFDLIIYNDVFEHLPNPIEALRDCEQRLNPGGLLVLNLPSSNGLFFWLSLVLLKCGQSSVFDRLWQKDLPSPHLSYFNPKNLTDFINRYSGLSLICSLPLPSIGQKGMKERVSASHKGLTGYIIYLGLVVWLPIIKLLPSDIFVLVFQKPSSI